MRVPRLPERIEQALIGGNLINLSPEERVSLYMATCKSLRLNHLTVPFGYILVEGQNGDEKLILYALKNCTDQLRSIRRVTVVPGSLRQWTEDGFLKAEITVQEATGRTDSDLGVIPMERWSKKHQKMYKLSGRDLANAQMHVVTKAKRRATLSLCGLGGVVDEAELDTMNVIGGVTRDGRIFRHVSRTEERDLAAEVEVSDKQNPHLKRFEERESEELAKIPPAVPCLWYMLLEKDEYEITGDQKLKEKNHDLLADLWNRERKAIICPNPEVLGKLISRFESNGTPFKELKRPG